MQDALRRDGYRCFWVPVLARGNKYYRGHKRNPGGGHPESAGRQGGYCGGTGEAQHLSRHRSVRGKPVL